jgi:CDP-6-deoxy-D-xylo-4-hexulose-3-dehydrase
MNNVFWIGVYPGLTKPMLDFVASAISEFTATAKSLPVLSSPASRDRT